MAQIDRLAFTRLCKEGQVFPVYYLFGDEAHYLQLYTASLVRFLLDKDVTDLNFSRYDADHLPEEILDAELESLPPFCPRRVVEIDRCLPALLCNSERKTKADSADGENEGGRKKLSEAWLHRIHDLPDTSVLILVDNLSLEDEKEQKKNTAHQQLMKEITAAGGCCVCLQKENETALTDLILRRAEKAGVTFDKELAAGLVAASSREIPYLMQEAGKLIAWAGEGGTVTKEAVAELSCVSKEEPYYLLADHVSQGKIAPAMQDFARLFAYGNAPELVLGMLINAYCALYRCRAALDAGVSVERYCNDFSLKNNYGQTKYFQSARNYDLSALRRGILLLEDCEKKMKSTALPKEGLLQETILRIATATEESA